MVQLTEPTVEVDQLAWVFQSRGVMAGNFVAIFMTNCPEMVIAMYALAKLGAVSAMINATLRRKLAGLEVTLICYSLTC